MPISRPTCWSTRPFTTPAPTWCWRQLACGLPVLTSRHNGAAELLRPVGDEPGERAEGYVIDDPHDHARLACCLERLLDPSRRRRCAEAARQTGAGWTFEEHYQGLVEILAEASQRRRKVA